MEHQISAEIDIRNRLLDRTSRGALGGTICWLERSLVASRMSTTNPATCEAKVLMVAIRVCGRRAWPNVPKEPLCL